MQTVLRFRPPTTDTISHDLQIDPERNVATVIRPKKSFRSGFSSPTTSSNVNVQQSEFRANHIFDTECTQQSLFDKVGKRLITNTLDGFNTSVFAYGQTGSGKTYTMFGDHTVHSDGLALQSLRFLFESIHSKVTSFTAHISAFEIYNDKIYDRLLSPDLDLTQPAVPTPLQLLDGKIINLTSIEVSKYEDTRQILYCAIESRMTAATDSNAVSSRSHLVITIDLQQHQSNGGSLNSKLHFIDLAGSERTSKTNAVGSRLTEAKSINSSLLALGRVVDALVKRSNSRSSKKTKSSESTKFIPYRASVITRLLKDSLGGNSMTTVIGCCSVDAVHLNETVSTLHFIARSASIKNQPMKNKTFSTSQIAQIQRHFQEYKVEATELMKVQKEEYEEMIAKLTEENETLRDRLNENSERGKERRKSVVMDLERGLKVKVAAHQRRLSQTQENMFKFDDLADTFKMGMFLEAVRDGEIESVERILHFVEIDGTNRKGESAMIIAVKQSDIKMVQYLMDKGASVNTVDAEEISLLMMAVDGRNVKMVELLCENGVGVDYRNRMGCTALHIAVSKGYREIVSMLITRTNDVDIKSVKGWTPMMFAVKSGHIEIVRMLLQYGDAVDVNAMNESRCTALMLAVFSGHQNIVRLLLDNGAKHSLRDRYGHTALIWANKKGNEAMKMMLEAQGSKLSARDRVSISF